jgi:AcrR family transcriptional regulator
LSSTGVLDRARVRAELTREILAAAHDELSDAGAAGLSLRAVARRLDMVPSALYRYFASRDALLTALIVEAYQAVGAAAETGVEAAAGRPPVEQWLAAASAVRRWGLEHPHDWALVYGSPVPGYQAPPDTIEAALAVTRVLCRIVSDAVAPAARPPTALPDPPAGLAGALQPIGAELLPGRPPAVVAAAVTAWTQLIGWVSLELFGHYVGGITDLDLAFSYAMRTVAGLVGLADSGRGEG